MSDLARVSVLANQRNEFEKIKFPMLFKMAKKSVKQINKDPIQMLKDNFDQSDDLNVTMAIIDMEIKELIAKNESSDAKGVLWITIWKFLYSKVPQDYVNNYKIYVRRT